MACYQEASPLNFLEGALVASYSASGTRHLMDTEGHIEQSYIRVHRP